MQMIESKKLFKNFIFIWCIIWSCFQIYVALFPISAFYERCLHVFFGLILVFLTFNFKGKDQDEFSIAGLIFSFIVFCAILYAMIGWQTKVYSRGEALSIDEFVIGAIFIFIILEAARRAVGLVIPLICIILFIYARFGENLPPILAHKNYEIERMVTSFYISFDGIMGPLMHVSTTYIFQFVLFGAFLRVSGAGEFFIKLAYSLFGRVRGGPAKIAVVASSIFGMISGSAIANVAGTGQFTIPLMKRYGYPAHFAAGVEAAASAGGQIMPPIMGGAAFIIIEVLGISYVEVMKAILIISIFYYVGIFMVIDIEAQKHGLRGVPKDEITPFIDVIKEGWHYLLPPVLLLVFLGIAKLSISRSAVYATLSVIVVSNFKKESRMGIKKIFEGMKDGCLTFRTIVAILACAGILVGIVNMTGLGLMLSGILVNLAKGNLLVLLFLTAIASIILGMGVPITAAYIILSILVAPALIKIGVLPIAAHLFIFYFGVFSAITPPFAPDAFVAAGIAGSNVMKTAISACKIGCIGIILPFCMIYDKTYLLKGSVVETIILFINISIGIYVIGIGIVGYSFGKLNFIFRIIFIIVGVMILLPHFGIVFLIFGTTITLIILLPRYLKQKKLENKNKPLV